MNITWKINVSEYLHKGSRDHMEDFTCNHIENVDGKNLFGVFGVFDGHGGCDAARYVKASLVDELKRNIKFWSNDDYEVLTAIKEVFSRLQALMWLERESWPQTIVGYKSTAGTTATIAVIRNDTVYVGHVGDSALVVAARGENSCLESHMITKEHKPNDIDELKRIEECGGTVVRRSGVERIVWHRSKKTPNNEVEQVPFLAVARSLGDLWSYDMSSNSYHVSPEPDLFIIKLKPEKHRALIIASDGIWNVIDGERTVDVLSACYSLNISNDMNGREAVNPAQLLVNYSLHQWRKRKLSSDNLSAVVVTLTPESHIDVFDLKYNTNIEIIQNEIVEEHILPTHPCSQVTNTLENIRNFSDYTPADVRLNESLNDTELLKTFVMASENLARHCVAWRDDVSYWNRLNDSFANLGITRFPNFISHFDSVNYSFEDVLCSFTWGIVFIYCTNEVYLSRNDIDKIHKTPLLTEYWISFLKEIINPNLSHTKEQFTEPSMYLSEMNDMLLYHNSEIRRFINGASGKKVYSLKKSVSFSNAGNSLGQTFYPNVTLKRSSSMEVSKLEAMSNVSSLPTIFNSGSSTPLMSPTQNTTPNTVICVKRVLQRYILSRRRSEISVSRRKEPNLSVPTLKRRETTSDQKVIKYVTRMKTRSN